MPAREDKARRTSVAAHKLLLDLQREGAPERVLIAELADTLQVARRTLNRWCERGLIERAWIAGDRRVWITSASLRRHLPSMVSA